MHSRSLIVRQGLLAMVFVLFYLLLNRPEVIFFSRIGCSLFLNENARDCAEFCSSRLRKNG
jgi:hypothetical protein